MENYFNKNIYEINNKWNKSEFLIKSLAPTQLGLYN